MNKTTSAQNIRYYDAEAEVYDENRYGSVKGRRVDTFQKELLGRYLDELPVAAEILDLGCGTGRFLSFLANRGNRLTGIDISAGMLEKARERIETELATPVRLLHSESERLPFDDESYDAVCSILVINLIEEYQKTFDEVARILKPDGIFIFNVPNLSSIYFPAGTYVNIRGKTRTANKRGYRYSHWFSRAEIQKALAASGFVMEEVRGQPPYVGLTDGVAPLSVPFIRWLLAKSVYVKARRGSG